MPKVVRLVFAVVIISLVCWVVSRWSVWFNKHPEPIYNITESVSCVQLTVGDNPMTERIVSWRSRPDSLLLSDSAVRLIWISEADTLYPQVNKKWIKSGGGEAIYYWCELEVQEGEYKYAIETIDSIDTVFTTTPCYTTQVDYLDSLQILVLGDVQDKCHNLSTDSAVQSLVQDYTPDFILQLGDLIHRPHQQYWDVYFESFAPICTSVPMISIVGNHDYHKGLNKSPDERFFYTFPYFLEDDGGAPEIGCLSLQFSTTRLYILDSNQPLHRQFKQRNWFKEQLLADISDYKILALHHPVRSARGRFNNLIVRWLYEDLIKKHDISLVLAGHEHTYYTLSSEQAGGYQQIITNFSDKTYDDAKGEKGRNVIELKVNTFEP